jgi:hypothetical protein
MTDLFLPNALGIILGIPSCRSQFPIRVYILSRVRGSVTNNNGFRIR